MEGLENDIRLMNELGTEAPGTEAPSTSSPATSAPSTEGPTTEAPLEPPVKQEDDKFDKLYAKIAELETKLTKKEKPATVAPSTEAPIDTQDFLAGFGDDDPYEIVSDKDKLNKLLNSVYQAGIKVARSQAAEGVLRQIPTMIRSNVETYTILTNATQKFYDTNPDLKPYAQQVAEVYEAYVSKNPERPIGEVFDTLADEVRKQLNLAKKAVAANTPKLPPGTTGKKAAINTSPKLSGVLAEIEAMNALED